MKKAFLFVLGFFISALFFVNSAQAATPTLSLSNTGSGDNVQVDIMGGDANGNVILYYQKTDGTSRLQYLGTTNSSGTYSTTVSTANYSITPSSLVYVMVNGKQSATATWPYTTTTGGAITLSQTGLVTTVGQSTNLTVNNLGSNLIYLLNNSNPQIANININNNQLTIIANTYGQTVVTVCVLGTTSNCASTYVTVQNSGATALTFSQSTLTVAYGQNGTVTILNSNGGSYSILNNSNPSVIQASIKDSTITLTANNNNGSAALTVCASNMSACGIINVSAGSVNSTGITFSQTSPSLLVGQTLSLPISGGSNYNISSNSNSNIIQASISGSNLVLVGGSTGSATITVCASTGNCGSVTATVSFATSGPITLSQNNLWLQVGQAISVTISGGTMPYSVLNNASSSSIVSSSLNNNILTLIGVTAGSVSLNVCSAGGACIPLSILVNGVSTNTQLTFSNNNLTLNAGSSTSVTLYGNGGYYVSNANNQNVALITVNGNTATVNALSAGNANASICQTGGQCGVIYVSVNSVNTVTTSPIFSQNSPSISVGQSMAIAISGGATSNYYISSNSNPTVVQANISGNSLLLLGHINGSSVIVVCAASNNCNSLAVTVGTISNSSGNSNTGSSTTSTGTVSTPTTNTSSNTTTTAPVKPKYKFTRYLYIGSVGEDVKALQTRLIYEGVYSGPVTGKFGALTYQGVKNYQKKNKISQLGVVGPATRASLNK